MTTVAFVLAVLALVTLVAWLRRHHWHKWEWHPGELVAASGYRHCPKCDRWQSVLYCGVGDAIIHNCDRPPTYILLAGERRVARESERRRKPWTDFVMRGPSGGK